MAQIIPFKAVRPTRDKVGLVASRSYETYTPEQREARLKNNPFSFLHIVNPGYRFDKEISGKARYTLVKNRYSEFKEDNIFVQDSSPCYYVYKITDRNKQEFTGIIAAASCLDYEKNVIKKHESTIAFREIIFKDYLKTVGFNAEPVLLTHSENPSLNAIINAVQQERAEYEFTTTYRDTHLLWPISDPEKIAAIKQAYQNMNSIYIADGHHRSASSHLLYEELKMELPVSKTPASYNYFMAYLIPETQVKIHEFNRLVKDLNGLSKDAFLIKLDSWFRIENCGANPYTPNKPHHFSMYLDGDFYSLHLRKSNYSFNSPLDDLDAQILYKTILQPVLGIHDLRNDNRLAYSSGKHNFLHIKSSVDSGAFKVGFGMLPATINQLKQIADEGLQMPPKSTYIEPKLRSGITIYEF